MQTSISRIELMKRMKMLDESEADELLAETTEVGRMLAALWKSLPRD